LNLDIEDHDPLTASALSFAPWLVLVGYAWLMFESYSDKLDLHLKYREPSVPAAPEDVLGFGFWLPWMIIATFFAFALAIAVVARKRKMYFAMFVGSIFLLLSAADLFLYRTLERQVGG
jgi:hypothetical protein